MGRKKRSLGLLAAVDLVFYVKEFNHVSLAKARDSAIVSTSRGGIYSSKPL